MSTTKTAAALLGAAGIAFTDECPADLLISDLVSDSRDVSPGALFCAYPGLTNDGRQFLSQAELNGASLVLCEAKDYMAPKENGVPIILVADLQARLGVLADVFFDHPSSKMQVFGVTGTNGKTTCCYLLAQAFASMGMKSAIMGTLGYGAIGALKAASHTTPDAISVHRRMAELCDQNVTQLCMEVSSHALDQGRVAGVQFYSTLFTNLSHDHLDYHGDMAAYGAAKKLLFTAFESELAVINADDSLGSELLDEARAPYIVSYGTGGDVFAEDVTPSREGISMHVVANGVDFPLQTPLVGLVNVANVLLLTSALLALSTPVAEIQSIVGQLTPAPGRMQLISRDGQPSVVIDYAHTPDALQQALHSVRQHCEGALWCVFGCGGDRDRDKRPAMGAIAAANADHLVVTNDNPRSEQPEQIAADIVGGIDGQVQVILDRAKAIQQTIAQAGVNDWVVIAGKGHEATQTIGEAVLHFSDQEQVEEALGVAA